MLGIIDLDMTREKYSQDPSSLNDSDILVKVASGEKDKFTERGNFLYYL